jgi:hypothetical protein
MVSICYKFALASALTIVLGGPVFADSDGSRAINAVGDGKRFIGDCTGKTVRLIGNSQVIALLGTCKSIVSRGSNNHITLDAAGSLSITGDGNTVKWRTKPQSVNAVGKNNSLANS